MLKIRSVISPSDSLLGMHCRDRETYAHTTTHAEMLMVVLLIISKKWTLSLNWRMDRKLQDLHPMEWYSIIKGSSCGRMQQHGWMSKASCLVKAARLKRLHMLMPFTWHVCEGTATGWGTDEPLSWPTMEGGMDCEGGTQRKCLRAGNFLYQGCGAGDVSLCSCQSPQNFTPQSESYFTYIKKQINQHNKVGRG